MTGGVLHIAHIAKDYFFSPVPLSNPVLPQQIEDQYQNLMCKLCPEYQTLKTLSYKEIQALDIKHLEEEYKLVNLLMEVDASKNPWQDPAIIKQQTLCLELGFLVGLSVLKELDYYIEEQNKKNEIATPYTRVTALTSQKTPRYRFFFLTPKWYHYARGCCTYRNKNEIATFTFLKNFYPINRQTFYQEGTPQAEWGRLYNFYCRAVDIYLNRQELEKSDDRFTKWTQPDLDCCHFEWNVGGSPLLRFLKNGCFSGFLIKIEIKSSIDFFLKSKN